MEKTIDPPASERESLFVDEFGGEKSLRANPLPETKLENIDECGD